MSITLYGAPLTRAHRVAWLLEELGVDWRYYYVDMRAGAHRSPDYLAINPAGKVPALRDGELLLIESSAICLYLAERYGAGRWLPESGTAASGLHHQWVSFITGELEQALWTYGKHKFALPRDWRVADMLEVAPREFAKAVALVEGWLPETDYLFGDKPLVADILLAHTLNWAVGFRQPLPPRAERYRRRVSARPQCQAALDREAAEATAGA